MAIARDFQIFTLYFIRVYATTPAFLRHLRNRLPILSQKPLGLQAAMYGFSLHLQILFLSIGAFFIFFFVLLKIFAYLCTITISTVSLYLQGKQA